MKSIIQESKGGFYISNYDLDECISIVENLINNPQESIRLGLSARDYIVSRFSKEKVLASFEAKLLEVIGDD